MSKKLITDELINYKKELQVWNYITELIEKQ
jgi:hypothetical protein